MAESGAAPIAVIGAGWSGLAAAVELTAAGRAVALIDAAPQAGGRARRLELVLGDRSYPLDNGQHLLIGAYAETLALMRRVGADPARAFERRSFTLQYADGFRLQAGRAPAPLHLAQALFTARGMPWSARIALARAVARWQRAGWRAPLDASAADVLAGQPALLIERLWEPLCVAALNLRPVQASGTMFLAVLRDSLGAGCAASDLLLPRGDLSALLPDAAVDWLQRAGACLWLRTPAQQLQRTDAGWRIHARAATLHASAVLLALPPARAAALLASAQLPALQPAVDLLAQVQMAPIATVYLRYPTSTRLPQPMLALREDAGAGRCGQWVFDRGALDPRCAGVLAVVVSADGPHRAWPHQQLAQAAAAQLGSELRLPAPLAARVVDDPQATIVPLPGLRRPPAQLPVAGLALAGDAADSAYPSTLEGAVRSGLAAARVLLAARG